MENPYLAADAFVKDFRQMEYAMKRSGFGRQDKTIAEADWDSFAQHLGSKFFEYVIASGLAKTLIGQPPRRLLNDMTWAPPNPSPLANVAQLIVNGVCRVRNSYIHGEKFTGGPDGQWERDVTLVLEAHAVLQEAMRYPGSPLPITAGQPDGRKKSEKTSQPRH
ncbi:hypothetical protein [Phyllobacterium chamaecytisi]|uniref:hypothetical protein n=1 Tax=Phyllobacterium chamaecytisi TaxID=2876082 RepID=UPI001CCF3BA3|nr:hypothetical protein [Phyllobacterium sp. KW56]MBZ9605049.1 hypothetical protein [Phyllobacterium sp. KW56]